MSKISGSVAELNTKLEQSSEELLATVTEIEINFNDTFTEEQIDTFHSYILSMIRNKLCPNLSKIKFISTDLNANKQATDYLISFNPVAFAKESPIQKLDFSECFNIPPTVLLTLNDYFPTPGESSLAKNISIKLNDSARKNIDQNKLSALYQAANSTVFTPSSIDTRSDKDTEVEELILQPISSHSFHVTRKQGASIVSAIFQGIGKLIGTPLGALLGGVSALIIHNPITCLLATLDGREWPRYGFLTNLARVLLSPWAFPIVASLDGMIDGAKVGFKEGFLQSLTVPYREWKYAPYTTMEILIPWVAAALTFSGIGILAGLSISGAVSVPTWAAFFTTAATVATKIAIVAAIAIGVYSLYEVVHGGRIHKGGKKYRDTSICQAYLTDEAKNEDILTSARNQEITPTTRGRFFQLPPSLDNSNDTPATISSNIDYTSSPSYHKI